jgi:hypothetical protein
MMRWLSSHAPLALGLGAAFGRLLVALSVLAVCSGPAAATAIVELSGVFWDGPFAFAGFLPAGFTVTCTGDAFSIGSSCGDGVFGVGFENASTVVQDYSIVSHGGFTITNNTDEPLSLIYMVATANEDGNIAKIDNLSVEYAKYTAEIIAPPPAPSYLGGFLGFDTCSVPFFTSTTCIHPSDFVGEPFPLPLALGPGDTVTYNFTIDIEAELKGDGRAVPEPSTIPLFATGLGLMALLRWRRRRGRDCHPLAACRW